MEATDGRATPTPNDGAGEPADAEALQDMASAIEKALETRQVSWQLLLGVSRWTALSGASNREKNALAQQHYLELVDLFKKQFPEPTEVGMFLPVGGVYLLSNGEMRLTVSNRGTDFDWSGFQEIVPRLAQLADDAKDWWQEGDAEHSRWVRWARGGGRQAALERRPHSARAYGLSTWLLSNLKQECVDRENEGQENAEPSKAFESRMATMSDALKSAEEIFRLAVQRTAQVRYAKGMLLGLLALVPVCALIGAVFYAFDTPAAYAVALPAGAVGAGVSVMHRMSSGRFRLNAEAAGELLLVLGMVRPLIGAIFGMALTAVIEGGLLPVLQPDGANKLAFFAALGFLAGFNERFAQDMLVGTAERVHPEAAVSS